MGSFDYFVLCAWQYQCCQNYFTHQKDDITKHGSGNPGTMNMIRTFGVGTGLLTLFFDCLKGALPALAGYLLFRGDGVIMANTALYAAGLAVVFGHMYPVVYKFKGGKSVACALGIFCVANPILLVCVFCASILYLYFLIMERCSRLSFSQFAQRLRQLVFKETWQYPCFLQRCIS